MEQDIERLEEVLRKVPSLDNSSRYASGKFGITMDRNLVYVYNNEAGNVIATVKQLGDITTMRVRRASKYANFLMNYGGFGNTRHVYSTNLAKRSRWVRSQLVGYIESAETRDSGTAGEDTNIVAINGIFPYTVTVTDLDSVNLHIPEIEYIVSYIKRNGLTVPPSISATTLVDLYSSALSYGNRDRLYTTSRFEGGINERIFS